MSDRPEIIEIRGPVTPEAIVQAKAFLAETERVWLQWLNWADKSESGRTAQRLADAPMAAPRPRGKAVPA